MNSYNNIRLLLVLLDIIIINYNYNYYNNPCSMHGAWSVGAEPNTNSNT